jgi:predicted RNase H-like HicB family nuclease
VLVEPVANNGYRASGLGPAAVIAEGKTETEALRNFQKAIEGRIRAGARLAYLDVAIEETGAQLAAGILDASDPLVQEWKEIMAENRRRDDQSPDVP